MRDEAKYELAWDLLEAGDISKAYKLFVEQFDDGDSWVLFGLAEIYRNKDFAEVQRIVDIARKYTEEDPALPALMIFQFIVPELWAKSQRSLELIQNGETSLEFSDMDSIVAARTQVLLEIGDLLNKYFLMGGNVDIKSIRNCLEFVLSESKALYMFSLALAKPLLKSARMLLESSSQSVRDQAYFSITLFFEHIATPDRIGAMYMINNLEEELATFEEEIDFFREIAKGLEELQPLVHSMQDIVELDVACDKAIKDDDKISTFIYRKIIGDFLEGDDVDSSSYELQSLRTKYLDSQT